MLGMDYCMLALSRGFGTEHRRHSMAKLLYRIEMYTFLGILLRVAKNMDRMGETLAPVQNSLVTGLICCIGH